RIKKNNIPKILSTIEMEPFVHLPEYPFLICQMCGYACVANEVATHLGKQHHEIKPNERSRIAKLIGEIPGIIPNQAGDEKAEPNPWLRRVGWAEHLKGLDKERLRESMGPIGEHEATLQRMWDSLGRVMDQARAAAVPIRVGHAVLFEVNRKEAHVKARKPFDSRMEDDTSVRYREVMRKLLCFIQRTEDWDDEARPPYTVTEKQG
ncbi:hypothetical protein V8F06_013819, partial [Rhypophila decipiens]